jgi:hypothetical protein
MNPIDNPKGKKSLKLPKVYRSDRSSPLVVVSIIIVSLGLMVGTFVRLIVGQSPSSSPSPALTSTPATPSIDTNADLISLDKFNQVQNGMTITQVQRLIGHEGKLLGSSTVANVVGKVYWWQNPQGSNALVEFRNDKVVSKSQAGLQ